MTSGRWGTSDAAATFLLKQVAGSFGDNHALQVGGVTHVTANGNAVLGLRGYSAVTWATGQTLEPMADVDIGANKPANEQFANPASEDLAPEGVSFTDAAGGDSVIALGNLDAGKLHGVWRREWIMDGHQSRSGIPANTRYSWS